MKKAKTRLRHVQNEKPVFSGLFLPHFAKTEDLEQAISIAKANGASGVSVFAYGNFKEMYEDILK